MKKDKGFKENINYFTKNETLKFVGIVLMVLAGLCYFFRLGFISYIIMSVGLPVGFILCLLGSFGRSSESDIDNFARRHVGDVEVDFDEDKHLKKRLLKLPEPLESEGYVFREGLMLKRGKGAVTRSSEYAKEIIYHLDTALYISFRRISVVSEDKDEGIIEIPYNEISSFEVISEIKTIPFGKEPVRVTASELRIEYSGGKVFTMPVESSIKSDAYVERVKEMIAKAKA